MAATDTLPTQDAAGLSIVDWRRINAGDVMRGTNGQVRLGILPAHTNDLVTSLSSMAVSVAPFNAVVSRTGAALGCEKLANASAEVVTLDPAPSSNSRIDVVWVRPLFVASADSSNVPVFGKTTGTASATPSKSAIPAGALELATVRIPSTATTTQSSGVQITQTVPYTTAAGGTLIFRNDDEMGAFTPPAGTTGYRLDTKQMWAHDGLNWTLAQAGLVLIRPGGLSGASLQGDGTVVVGGGTSFRVDDCFSTRYRHYRVVLRATLSGAGNIRAVLTSGGVDRATNYRTIASVTPGNTGQPVTSFAEGPSVTNWFLTTNASTVKMLALDLFNPGVGQETYGMGLVTDWGGATVASETWTGAHEVAAGSDGIRVFIQDGAAFTSADMKIYAYA